LAAVVTLTVTFPAEAEEKSTVFTFSASPVFTWHDALGAVVVQEKYTRPLPAFSPTLMLLVFPDVAPAFTVIEGGLPMLGTGTAVAR